VDPKQIAIIEAQLANDALPMIEQKEEILRKRA
jgi:hypothetical protein